MIEINSVVWHNDEINIVKEINGPNCVLSPLDESRPTYIVDFVDIEPVIYVIK